MADCRVTLVFDNDEARDWFLGQLSDGFGENDVVLEYAGALYAAKEIRVIPAGEAWEHARRMNAKYGRQHG